MKTRQLEMRARGHANRGPALRHRNATLMKHGKDMEYDMQTCKKNSSKMRGKTAPKQGEMTPDAWHATRNAKLGT